jgi:glycine/D-amino acid oxidase-like deaminating enzyme
MLGEHALSKSARLKEFQTHMKDYSAYSYWLETCKDDLTPRAHLEGSIDVDVAILGAGFTGLWTAYYLHKQEPSLKIAILEKEIAGFGASGRNGGGCSSGFPIGASSLAERYGREAAIGVQRAMWDAVDEIGRVAEREKLDIDWHKSGYLRIARGQHQAPVIERTWDEYVRFGLADHYELLDRTELESRVRVSDARAAILNPVSATLHPGKLVRGLARTVEQLGVDIYEQTEVTEFTTGAYPALHTNRGHARAKTIVLAGESYMSRLKATRRNVLPAYSLIVLTEPISDSDWEQIGWHRREFMSSCSFMVNYLSRLKDGRLLFGGRGAPYRFGSKIKDEYDRHAETHQMLMDNVRNWFPPLEGVRFTHSWGGPLGWSRDYMPTMTYDPKENLAMAGAYTGTGITPSNIAGRLLADLITFRDSELTQLPMAHHKLRKWEPEPFRYLGVRFVQRGFAKLDDECERTGMGPTGTSLVERITKH